MYDPSHLSLHLNKPISPSLYVFSFKFSLHLNLCCCFFSFSLVLLIFECMITSLSNFTSLSFSFLLYNYLPTDTSPILYIFSSKFSHHLIRYSHSFSPILLVLECTSTGLKPCYIKFNTSMQSSTPLATKIKQ